MKSTNLHQSRNYGYSPKNMKAIRIVKGGRGKNISSMVAIKNTEILAYDIREGSFDGDCFITFIQEKLKVHCG